MNVTCCTFRPFIVVKLVFLFSVCISQYALSQNNRTRVTF